LPTAWIRWACLPPSQHAEAGSARASTGATKNYLGLPEAFRNDGPGGTGDGKVFSVPLSVCGSVDGNFNLFRSNLCSTGWSTRATWLCFTRARGFTRIATSNMEIV
jgi:hypothetical protein